MIRRVLGMALVASLALAASIVGMSTAHATQYRYWTYWHGADGDWQFSAVGPASAVPADGDVEGWRFAITEGVRGQGQEPRISVRDAFRQFCGARTAAAGQKRVAVVFDFGEAADAPTGQSPPAPRGVCVVTAAGGNGAQILSQAASIRTDRGLVCAIADYPRDECAPALTPSSSPTPERSPKPRAAAPAADPGRTVSQQDGARAKARVGTLGPVGTSGSNAATDTGTPTSTADDADNPPGNSDTATGAGNGNAANNNTGKGGATDEPDPRESSTPAPPRTQAAPESSEAAAPVFIAADAAVTEPSGRSWVPLAAVAALIGAIAGFAWWRRTSA